MTLKFAVLLVALGLAACSKSPDPAPSASPPASNATVPAAPAAAAHEESGVAWRKDDVDAAFAEAKVAGKPVFLYWGATWCPPCNQVKATIFNRQDFIERSRHFIPVYVDGDRPSAQKQGARFSVSAYPTMVLFTPDGTEITRLPGEVDADQYMRVLAMGMNGARPVKATLTAALAAGSGGATPLTPEDWRMLAYYSWVTDEQQLTPRKELAATLARLAKACPSAEVESATRLEMQALAAAADDKGAKPRADPAAIDRMIAVLGDSKRARENFDLITYYAGKIAAHVAPAPSAARSRLVATWNTVLDRFIADPAVATDDRLVAVNAKVELARLDNPKGALPEPLLAQVRSEAQKADRDTVDVYARQSAISGAADVLAEAGLLEESDALLTRELTRSHSPYYFMLGLAANAKKRGDKAGALDWAQKAYAAAEGPATRLQWGTSYMRALIAALPDDAARVERVAGEIIGELDPVPETFYERNRRALERLGKDLAAWNKDRRHDASLQRIRKNMAEVCAKLPAADPARATCDGVLAPARA